MNEKNYINPYSDTFTSRLIKTKEQREKQLEADAYDVVKSRRCNGLQFSTNSGDSTYLHSSMKTFIARPLSACKIRSSSSSNLFDNSYDKESITRNRSASTTNRYKDGEKNVFEHLSNLAKNNNNNNNNNNKRPMSSSSSSSSTLKPWLPSGNNNNNNEKRKCHKKPNDKEKRKNSKLMNNLYVYANTNNSNTKTKINTDIMYTPTINYKYNDDYSFNNTPKKDIDIYSEISQNIYDNCSKKHDNKSIISQNSKSSQYKKVLKESSRLALSGYLIDKTTVIESCRQGILLLNRGSTSGELILAIRQQFGCHNISDVILNFKTKNSESPISRSYSMDKLEDLPPINENCEFVAYIGGSAIIDGTQNNSQNELDYDYRGLRDRLAKKLHSFSIGGNSPINEGYNNDILSISTLDTDIIIQHNKKLKNISSNDLSSSKVIPTSTSVAKPKLTIDVSSLHEEKEEVVMAPSLIDKIKTKNLSTSSTSTSLILKKSQKAIVQSLLSSNNNDNKSKTTSTLSSLFPYNYRSSINQSNNNNNNNCNNNNNKINNYDDDHSIISTPTASTFNNNTQSSCTTINSININNDSNTNQNATKPKIKFQLDLNSLLND